MLGPISVNTQIFNCDSANKFLAQVQSALNCLAGDHDHFQHYKEESLSDWLQNGSLHQTIISVDTMLKLLNNDEEITSAKQAEAYKVFQNITNYQQTNLNDVANNIADAQQKILDLNSFYFFMSLGIVLILVIWIVAISGVISWAAALFITVFIFLFLYLFSIAYRKQGQNIINEERNNLQGVGIAAQINFEQSIVYWAKGLLAAAATTKNDEY